MCSSLSCDSFDPAPGSIYRPSLQRWLLPHCLPQPTRRNNLEISKNVVVDVLELR